MWKRNLDASLEGTLGYKQYEYVGRATTYA